MKQEYHCLKCEGGPQTEHGLYCERENQMDLDLIADEYSTISGQLERLEARKEVLRKQIELILPDEGAVTTFMKASWVNKTDYDSAPTLKKLKDNYKKQSDAEKKALIAENFDFKTSRYLKVEVF